MKLTNNRLTRLLSRFWKQYQRRLYTKALHRTFQPILQSSPTACTPTADTEIHTLTSHDHLAMYLSAIKSLLRFHAELAVVAHDDGTLTQEDNYLLHSHVPGVRVINRRDADAKISHVLKDHPISRHYRSSVVNALELFDFLLLAGSDRIICMNSDVLFLERPKALIDWCVDGKGGILGVFEEKPAYQDTFLASFGCNYPPNITLGLLCCYKDIIDLDFIEATLARIQEERMTGVSEDHYRWYYGQNLYPLLMSRKSGRHRPSFLDRNSYQASGVFTSPAIFRHYWTSTGFFFDTQRNDFNTLVGQIGK